MAANVKPLFQFGLTTQRALEEFRLNYNVALASMPKPWADVLGDVLPGNSLKDTYPIALDAQRYREMVGEPGPAISILAKELSIVKREWVSAARADARRIKRGDFAYIQQWARRPEAMARARVFLRNRLIAALLVNGATTVTPLDGQNFFSTTHPVNPFDGSIKDKAGNATFSNSTTAATPLNANNLTAEKTKLEQIPGPDGEELGLEVTHVVVPTSLWETAYNLLKIQDLISNGALTDTGAVTIRNPHLNGGTGGPLTLVRAPELPGTDATADWYLVSATGLQQGLFPWVLSEDASEEMRIWDESSDFYKQTGEIKIQSHVMLEAAMLFPHAIRKIKGS